MASMDPRSSLKGFERLAAARLVSSAGLEADFGRASRAGDRPGMLVALLAALDPPTPGDCFRGKDEARAEDQLRGLAGPELLAEPLARAPWAGRLFLGILAQRAQAWYRVGKLERCLRDCRLFGQLASEDQEEQQETRIGLALLAADCCRARGLEAEPRLWMNEAMRRLGERASRDCNAGDAEAVRRRKAELLAEFLRRKPSKPEMRDAGTWLTDELAEKKIPKLEGKVNDFLSNCSDAVALGTDKTKGRMLYAARNIKVGSVLIVDQPYSFCTDIAALPRNCLYCHVSLRLESNITVPCENCQTVQFCSIDCQQRAWNKFHKYECRIFDYFIGNKIRRTNAFLAYRSVVTAALDVRDSAVEINQEFLQLHNADNDVFDVTTLKKYESQDYKTVFGLETNCARSDPSDNFEQAVHSIFFAQCLIYSLNYYYPKVENYQRHLHVLAVALLHNMQAINCNAYEVVENVRDDETKILEPRNVGGAIYTSVSLTNHSCYPNIARHSYPCGIVVVQTLRFIQQGEEILDCYGQHFLENKRDSRRKLLEKKYYFNCQCVACTLDWPLTLPNDQFNFKCKKCSKQCRRTRNAVECVACGQKTEISKLYTLLQTSIKKRLSALTKMYDSNYQDALPLLLEHANTIDKILTEPSLEAIKTQQSIIQCLNAMSSTSV